MFLASPWSSCTVLSVVMYTLPSPPDTTILMGSTLAPDSLTCCLWSILSYVLLSQPTSLYHGKYSYIQVCKPPSTLLLHVCI